MPTDGLLGSKHIKRVHLTGIGGISMSGLAEILSDLGYIVTGSDMKPSPIMQKLDRLGIKTTIGHFAENVAGADLLVYTAAVRADNPEITAAVKAGIPCIDRATLLGGIMKKYPRSIAVSGTHGKTTTTSMISMIMLEEGLDPTIHIGGELTAIGGTTRIGKSDYFIAEACEYTGSFLKLHPKLEVILNIEFDHADYFRDIDDIKDTFRKYASLVPADGCIVANADDMNVMEVIGGIDCNKVTFGLNSKDCTWSAADISFDEMGNASYTLLYHGDPVTEIRLKVPGMHNVSNSLAAVAACSFMGCSPASAARAFLKFSGTCRRFEIKGVSDGVTVIDDYAHHPSEITATLKAAANLGHNRIWCVFQPHTYSRTKCLMNDFVTAFDKADILVLTDIYAAREADTGEVSSAMLADRITRTGKTVVYIKDFGSIAEYLDKNARPGDIILTMGAGDIYKVGEMFLEARKKLAVS